MKILRKGKDYPEHFVATCDNCKCKFIVYKGEYTIGQYGYSYVFNFSCPYCHKKLRRNIFRKRNWRKHE